MNQQEEEANNEPVNIRAENRRVQRDAPKPPKKEEKDEWGDDVEDDLGL